MTFVTFANGFEYSTSTFDLIAEAERIEARIAGDVNWVGKWKLGGRAHWYRECAKSQAHHEHRVFDWTNGTAICTCGLVKDGVSSRDQLLTAPGHIDISTKQPETFYVFCQELDEDTDCMVCFCEPCGTVAAVATEKLTIDGDVPLELFLQLRQAHVCGSQETSAA